MRMMIDSYRTLGHHFAKLDPLYLSQNHDVFGEIPANSLEAA